MSLSQGEIYSLAKSVGLNDSRAKVAAAIAMAESSGDPNAHNATPPDDSYGLWQINMLGAMGPARRQQFGIPSNNALYNPTTNAKAMKALSQDGGNFSPWSTYTNGAYQRYMNVEVADESKSASWLAKIAAFPILGPAASLLPGVSNPISDATQGITTIATAVAKSAAWLSNSQNWVRIGFVTGGAVITIAGLVMVVQSTQTGRAVTKAATKVASKGKL